jgi:hypothetical protein
MPAAASVAKPPLPESIKNQDCLVWLRHECDLPTTCQPVAARGSDEPQWQGRIRDISAGGVGLIMVRRFERGTGVAIELPPSGGYPGDTVLARVENVKALPGGSWLLGCAFVSPLSESTVDRVIDLEPVHGARRAASPFPNGSHEGPLLTAPFVIPQVQWHNRETGMARVARRLIVKGFCWPLPPRMVLRLWVETKTGDDDFTRVRVNSCVKQGETWIVSYSILGKPTPRVSRWMEHG